jgi:glycosyltransferase involved in cell wall biosynthesis
MKILNIGLDKKLFLPKSQTQERVLGYSKLFERFDLIVLSGRGYKNIEFENMLISPTNSFSKLGYLFDAYILGKKMIKKYKHDIISAQDPFEIGLIAWLLAKKYGLKLQVQIHGDYFGSPYWKKESLMNNVRYYLGKYIIKKADGVRVVSNRTKESLIKFGLTPEKISVAPIYVSVSDKSNIAKIKKDFDKFIFLTVGRLVPVKNIFLQIEAMNQIMETYPKTELWIVGEGPEREKLEYESKKFKIDKNIKFFGWKDNLGEFYQQADAFLLTSNYEGWAMVAIEAASFGLPIIMTDVGCAGEIIKDGESGVIIKVGDREVLLTAMKKLIEDKDFGKKIGERAKEEVLSLPGQEQNLNLHKQSFNNLM